jgi:hypothetical protein
MHFPKAAARYPSGLSMQDSTPFRIVVALAFSRKRIGDRLADRPIVAALFGDAIGHPAHPAAVDLVIAATCS